MRTNPLLSPALRRRAALAAAPVALALTALIACGGGSDDAAATAGDGDASAGSGSLASLDRAAERHAPAVLEAIAAQWIPKQADGLLGRNAQWGALYSPRFQLGAGRALRVSLAADRPDHARRAFTALRVGAEAIASDGVVPSSVPPEVAQGATPSAADVASAAAFFLGDACTGMVALAAVPDASAVATPDVRASVEAALVRGARWLQTQSALLLASDAQAPNRLLFDARALRACAVLGSDPALMEGSRAFVDAFLQLQHPEGYFREGAGWDTSYQAVSLVVGVDVLRAGPAPDTASLAAALHRGAGWLSARVGPQGTIDSSGNSRTCGGKETFLDESKGLSLVDVIWGLLYVGLDRADPSAVAASDRVSRWATDRKGQDPCMP